MSNREGGGWSGPAWISIASPEGGGTSLRITRRGDRWVVTALYLHATEVTPSMLKAVPLGHLDVLTNLMTKGTLFINPVEWAKQLGGKTYPLIVEDNDGPEPSLAALREQAKVSPRELPTVEPTRERERLTRPDGSDPETFYGGVAEAYREYASQSRSPAVRMAEEAGVPVTTAHRWIREARRRGHLPAGRAGKKG